jgi:hypothetical protein
MDRKELTKYENDRLRSIESSIQGYSNSVRKSIIAIGGLLKEIRDERLFSSEYDTFEQYIKERWGWTSQYGNMLIRGSDVHSLLPEAERKLIVNPNQAHALSYAPENERVEILRDLQSTGIITAPRILAEIEKRGGERNSPEPNLYLEMKALISPTKRLGPPKEQAPETTSAKPRTYGNPIYFRGLRNEPINENGVVFLFGLVAKDLGFSVESVQAGFPDCDAKQEISRNKWRHVRIEFEYESKNFYVHGHDPNGCDMIVCWKHNWADCPANIEVIELSTRIKSLPQAEE